MSFYLNKQTNNAKIKNQSRIFKDKQMQNRHKNNYQTLPLTDSPNSPFLTPTNPKDIGLGYTPMIVELMNPINRDEKKTD